MTGRSTRFDGVLETALYHDPGEREDIERFYGDSLGLTLVARWPDGLAFRVGASVLLLFDRVGLADRDGPIADHGTTGPGHACLIAHGEQYEETRQRLTASGVEITHDHEWSEGRRSFYFHDPAGNLLEVADGDLWPQKYG